MLFRFYLMQEGLKLALADTELFTYFICFYFASLDIAVNRHIGDPQGGGEFLDGFLAGLCASGGQHNL